MMRSRQARRPWTAAALAAAVVVLPACSDLNAQDTFRRGPATSLPDAGILQPSAHAGGTLRLATTAAWPSLDPAQVVAPDARDFFRNYARTLTVFRAAPPDVRAPTMVVPDLATSLGVASSDATTWTYTLRDGVKYDDGTPVTAPDVAYGVQRSLDRSVFPGGMDWFDGALRSVSAPDSRTVVFKLSRPVPNFDYFAQLPVMAPVPRSRDDGAGYGAHVAATGPYKIASAVGQAFTFVRNPAYDAASDPLSKRAALPAEFDVRASVPPADLARGLHDKTIDMQIGAARDGTSGQVLGDSSGQAPVDTAVLPSIAYTLINSGVEPFANEDCRRAVILAADRSAYQRAYGGPAVALAATGLLPPADPGAEPKDAIKLEPSPQGDVAAAQQALVTCKRPGGFSTTLGYRQGNQRDAAAAAGLKTSLARVHIDVHITEFPAADLYTVLANNQPYSVQHRIGLVMAERSAAWPDAEPLLRTIVDGSASGVVANVDMRYLAEGAQLLRQDTLSPNEVARRGAWLQIDELAMLAAYVVPGAWGQNSLYRPKGVTNLIVNQAFGLYDYARLGKSGGK